MRYRNRIKICKGVNLNISKSGISTSVGIPGLSVSTGKRGTYLNTGIPGTGFYDRQKIGGGSSLKAKNGVATSQQKVAFPIGDITLDYHEDGSIDFILNGEKIYDDSVIRQIKKSDVYKIEVQRLGQERIRLYKEKIGDFISIAQLSTPVHSTTYYEEKLRKMVPQFVQAKAFPNAKPTIDSVREALEIEANENVSALLPGKKRKLQEAYVNERLVARYNSVIENWTQAKEKYDSEAAAQVEKENARRKAECEDGKEKLSKLLQNDKATIEQTINAWIDDIEFPFDFDLQYEISDDYVTLDIDLPEIEEMLTVKPKEMANGIVKMVDKTQKEVKEDYATCAFGLALFFASHIFNIAVGMQKVVLSGYTQRRNKAGDIVDDYIYSIKFTRSEFMELDYNEAPDTNCFKFENRCNQLMSKEFKAIEPYA